MAKNPTRFGRALGAIHLPARPFFPMARGTTLMLWIRWYAGTCEDGKFRAVTRLSRVTLSDVIATWAFLLENAGDKEHRGTCVRSAEVISAVLDFDGDTASRILSAMQQIGLINITDGVISICNWGKRQFESDLDRTAALRQRRWRDGQRSGPVTRDKRVTNGHVTRE